MTLLVVVLVGESASERDCVISLMRYVGKGRTFIIIIIIIIIIRHDS